jgi:hypothetical protein
LGCAAASIHIPFEDPSSVADVNSVQDLTVHQHRNLFSQHYDAVFGFPAWPFTTRTGFRFTLGGEQGGWRK